MQVKQFFKCKGVPFTTTEVLTGCLKGKSNLIWGAIKTKMQYQRSSWFGFHFVVTM